MFKSSLGKKYWMAVTGLFLMVFVVAHLLGNLQIFLGPEWMNAYARHLIELPLLLWPARAGLLLTLLVHMTLGIWLAVENRRARPVRYAVNRVVQAGVASRSMVFLGLSVFSFVVFHLLHFTFGVVNPSIFNLTDEKGRHDVYSMVVLGFRDRKVALVYLTAMFFLAAHLRHGAYSFLQSLGLLRESGLKKARVFALLFALFVFFGYGSIAVSCHLGWLEPLQGASHGT